jgi:hypothetical protein
MGDKEKSKKEIQLEEQLKKNKELRNTRLINCITSFRDKKIKTQQILDYLH